MLTDLIASVLVKLLLATVGHEEAPRLVSDEAKLRAKAAADAVAAARKAADKR